MSSTTQLLAPVNPGAQEAKAQAGLIRGKARESKKGGASVCGISGIGLKKWNKKSSNCPLRGKNKQIRDRKMDRTHNQILHKRDIIWLVSTILINTILLFIFRVKSHKLGLAIFVWYSHYLVRYAHIFISLFVHHSFFHPKFFIWDHFYLTQQ